MLITSGIISKIKPIIYQMHLHIIQSLYIKGIHYVYFTIFKVVVIPVK